MSGMPCGHCVGAVTKPLKALPGADIEEIADGKMTVRYDSRATSPTEIAQAVEDAGYGVVSTTD